MCPDTSNKRDMFDGGGLMFRRWAPALLILIIAGCADARRLAPPISTPSPAVVPATAPALTTAPTVTATPAAFRGLGRLAFIRNGRLVLLDGEAEREIAGVNPSGPLEWSADGRWLAFRQEEGEKSRIMLLDATTGKVGEVPGVPDPPVSYAWTPSGSGLAVSVPGGIWVIDDLAAAEPRLLASTETPAGGLTWSPDGSRIAWVRTLPFTDPESRSDVVEMVPASGGQPVRWHVADGAGVNLAGWWPDGQGLLFWLRPAHCNSCAADGLRLRSMDLGKKGVVLPITLMRQGWLSPLPDGNRVLLVQGGGRTTWDEKSLAVCAVETGDCTTLAQPDSAVSLDPALSPDGGQIAFVRATRRPGQGGFASDRELEDWVASRTLWLSQPDGTRARQVAAAGGGIYAPAWSGDGKHLLFIRDGRLWVLELETEEVALVTEVGEPKSSFGYYGAMSWWSDRLAWSR